MPDHGDIENPDELLSLAAIAQWLHVAPSAVTNWRRRFDGDFPAPAGGTEQRPLFRKGDIAHFLRTHHRGHIVDRAAGTRSGTMLEDWLAVLESASGRVGDVSAPLQALADLGARSELSWRSLTAASGLSLEQPQHDRLGRTAQDVLRWGQRRTPDLRRLAPVTAEVEAVIRLLTPPESRSIVDLAVGEGQMLFAALGAAPGASALALDVDPDAIAVIRSRAASDGRTVETVLADATAHYFAGRQYDVVLAEPGPARARKATADASGTGREPRADDSMLDTVERVLAPDGVAFLVLPVEWLERPETERERRRLLDFDILDAVLLLPRTHADRGQVLLVIRPDRAGRQGVLLVDGGGMSPDRIADGYGRWVETGRVLSSHAVERGRAELLVAPANLTPRRWMRTEAERLGGAKAAAALHEDLAALRAGLAGLPPAPEAHLTPRRAARRPRIQDLVDNLRLQVVGPSAGSDLGVLTAGDLLRRRGSVRVDRVLGDRVRAGRGSSSVMVLPGDVVVLEERRRVVVAVWRGDAPVRIEGKAVVYRVAPTAEIVPEYLAIMIRAQLERYAAEAGRALADIGSVTVPMLPLAEQHEVVRVSEELASLEAAATQVRDRARALRRRLRDLGSGGVIGFGGDHTP